MANMTCTKKLSQIRKSYRDTSASFKKYKQSVLYAINVSVEIIDYMKEWATEHRLHNEDTIRIFERLSRECKIYISRLKHLEQSLQKCRRTIQRLSQLIVNSKDSKDRASKLEECGNSILQWFHLRRDFNKCFRQAMSNWTKVEETIFALE